MKSRLSLLCIMGSVLGMGLLRFAGAQVTQEWVARYNGPGGYDQAYSLAVDGDGNVYVAGGSTGSGTGEDYATIKYNAVGVEQWVSRYNGPGNSNDVVTSLAVDGNGNVYVTGYSTGSGTYNDYATIKYNTAGVQQWVARYDGPANTTDYPEGLAVDGDGNVYVTGGSTGSGTGQDYATIKYNAVGVEQWVSRYNGPGNSDDQANSLAVDGNSNVYVTGLSIGSGTSADYATIKYNAAGVQQWVARYNGPGNGWDQAGSLVVDGSGNVYVAGYSTGGGTGHDYATIKYNAAGQEQWVSRYNGPGNSEDWARSLAVDGNGNVYATGLSVGSGTNDDYATIKYDDAGVRQWVARYNGPENDDDRANSLAVDGDGNVYVTGRSAGSGVFSGDFVTIKYNATGVQQWVERYNGPDNGEDEANSLAVDGDGNVYVTGDSEGIGTGPDYATIKYNQTPQPPLDVTLAPVNPPIIIPATGGSFNYNATVSNLSGSTQSTQIWIMVQLPNLAWYGPALGPVSLTLPGGGSITRLRSQTVPATAPAGLYTYRGYLGTYPSTKIDSSSFTFTKSAIGDGGPFVSEAECFGEPFPGEVGGTSSVASDFNLISANPNPFNPSTVIRYQMPDARFVSLKVYDTTGRLVAILVDGMRDAGTHEATFDGSNLASGIYLAHIEAGPYSATQKLVLMK